MDQDRQIQSIWSLMALHMRNGFVTLGTRKCGIGASDGLQGFATSFSAELGRGIRTPVRLPEIRFSGGRHKPLGHPSDESQIIPVYTCHGQKAGRMGDSVVSEMCVDRTFRTLPSTVFNRTVTSPCYLQMECLLKPCLGRALTLPNRSEPRRLTRNWKSELRRCCKGKSANIPT